LPTRNNTNKELQPEPNYGAERQGDVRYESEFTVEHSYHDRSKRKISLGSTLRVGSMIRMKVRQNLGITLDQDRIGTDKI